MSKSLHHHIANLPPYIGNEIFKFLIPDSNMIEFNRHILYIRKPYNSKYQIAFIGDDVVKNNKELHLSRISKKNGKHRYYITQTFVDVIHVEHNYREVPIYCHEFSSTYVGKSLDNALILLLLIMID